MTEAVVAGAVAGAIAGAIAAVAVVLVIREGEGVAARSLDALGMKVSRTRAAVERMIGRGEGTTAPSEITLSPRTKKVIELAADEARKLGHSDVRTEHLLLGLAREGGGMACRIIEQHGVTLERVRDQVIETLKRPDRPESGQGEGQGGSR